jgi:hypothetical protein
MNMSDLANRITSAKKGLCPYPFETLPGLNCQPMFAVSERDIDSLTDSITALEAEVKLLRKALTPFKQFSDYYGEPMWDNGNEHIAITVAIKDLRRAATALSTTETQQTKATP